MTQRQIIWTDLGFVIALFITIGLCFLYSQTAVFNSNAHLVYVTCNKARTNLTEKESCVILQEKLGYEFLCSANNTNPNTTCWTEKND